MIITAIHFKRTNESSFKSYRFSSGSGQFRNTWIFAGEPSESGEIFEAIESVFNDSAKVHYNQIIIETSDDSGDDIVIIKERQIKKFYKNGSDINRSGLLQSIFGTEIDLSTFKPNLDTANYLISAHYSSLDPNNSYIQARPTKEAPFFLQALRGLERDIASVRSNICALFGTKNIAKEKINFHSLSEIVKNKDHALLIRNELDLIEKENKAIDRDTEDLNLLARKSEIISKLEHCNKMINSQAKTFKDHFSRSEKVSQQINLLKTELNISPKEALENKSEYHKGFRIFARLELLQKINEILQEKQTQLNEVLSTPLVKISRKIKAISNLDLISLNQFNVKISLLENKLRFIDSSDTTEANQKDTTWFDNFKVSPPTEKQKSFFQKNGLLVSGKNHDLNFVSDIKALTKDVIKEVQVINESFNKDGLDIKDLSQEFSIIREAYSTRLKDIEDQLLQFTVSVKAPPIKTFSSYLEFFIKASQLVAYALEKHSLEHAKLVQKSVFDSARNLIMEWRLITNSHKDAPLNTPQYITSEMKVVLKYASLIRARHETALLKVASRKHLDARKRNLEVELERFENLVTEILGDMNIFTKTKRDEIFSDLSLHVALLEHFEEELRKTLSKQSIIPFAQTGALISTWAVSPEIESEKSLDILLDHLSSPINSECRIISMAHRENASLFYRKGCGRITVAPALTSSDEIYRRFGIKRQTLDVEEINAITKPMPKDVSSQTIANKSANKPKNSSVQPRTPDRMAIDDFSGKVIKSEKINRTLDILNGRSR